MPKPLTQLPPDILEQAVAQYPRANAGDQMVVCRFYTPRGKGEWYLLNVDPDYVPETSDTCLTRLMTENV